MELLPAYSVFFCLLWAESPTNNAALVSGLFSCVPCGLLASVRVRGGRRCRDPQGPAAVRLPGRLFHAWQGWAETVRCVSRGWRGQRGSKEQGVGWGGGGSERRGRRVNESIREWCKQAWKARKKRMKIDGKHEKIWIAVRQGRQEWWRAWLGKAGWCRGDRKWYTGNTEGRRESRMKEEIKKHVIFHSEMYARSSIHIFYFISFFFGQMSLFSAFVIAHINFVP